MQICLLLVLLLFSQSQEQSNWKWVHLADLKTARLYYEPETASKSSEGNPSAWFKTDMKGRIGKNQPTRLISLSEFDCQGRRIRILQITAYRKDGHLVSFNGPLGWQSFTPATTGAAAFARMCRKT